MLFQHIYIYVSPYIDNINTHVSSVINNILSVTEK